MGHGDHHVYLRHPQGMIAANSSGTVFVSPDGHSFFLPNEPELLCRLLEVLSQESSPDEIEQRLGVPFKSLEPVLSLLEHRGIVAKGSPESMAQLLPARPGLSSSHCKRIVVGISGTVQAANIIPLLVNIQCRLTREIDVVLSETASHFISPEALAYFDFRVLKDMYQVQNDVNVPHIHLASTADLVLVLPASAHTISRLAQGTCSDLLALIVAATKAPVVVVPTMNPAMMQFVPIRRNMEILRSSGIYTVEPAVGYEISRGQGEEAQFCGIGLTEANVVGALLAILTAHREVACCRAGNGVKSGIAFDEKEVSIQPLPESK